VQSIIGVCIVFDIGHMTQDQQAAVLVLANAILAVFLRSQVTTENVLRNAGTSTAEVKDVASDPYAAMTVRRVD
jgi:hypothetical protein